MDVTKKAFLPSFLPSFLSPSFLPLSLGALSRTATTAPLHSTQLTAPRAFDPHHPIPSPNSNSMRCAQKSTSKEKTWSSCETPTPDLAYSPTRFSKKFVLPCSCVSWGVCVGWGLVSWRWVGFVWVWGVGGGRVGGVGRWRDEGRERKGGKPSKRPGCMHTAKAYLEGDEVHPVEGVLGAVHLGHAQRLWWWGGGRRKCQAAVLVVLCRVGGWVWRKDGGIGEHRQPRRQHAKTQATNQGLTDLERHTHTTKTAAAQHKPQERQRLELTD